jgi:hypothetical protein
MLEHRHLVASDACGARADEAWLGKLGSPSAVALVVVGSVVLLAMPGCARRSSEPIDAAARPEASLAAQAQAVRGGASDSVRLDDTAVRDEHLDVLDGLGQRLRRVNFSRSEISDAGLARLCQNAMLEQLRLQSPRVTDAGLAHVAGLKHLRFLHLLDAPITDAGLDQLHHLKQLESLYLDNTRVSDAGLARLIEAIPKVHLHIDDHHHPLDPRGSQHKH